jgi:hypothetical protein
MPFLSRRSVVLAASLVACGDPVPEGMTIAIIPENPTTADGLTAVLTDLPEGEGVTYTYQWSVDGAPVADITGPFVPADRTERDQQWTVVATPTSADGKRVGATQNGETVIANSGPIAQRVAITPTTPTSSDPLVAAAVGTDVDGDALTWTYTWYINGTEVQSGASDTLDIGEYIDRDNVDVVAVASDGAVDSVPTRSSPVLIRNSLPILSATTIVPAESGPHGFTDLTCTPGEVYDQDGDEITYQYEWWVNGVRLRLDQPTVNRIGRHEDEIVCQARPWDGKGYGEWIDSPTVTLANTPPEDPVVAVGPDEASQYDVLTCDVLSPLTDWDGDVLSYTFTWTRDGAAFTGSTATTNFPGDTIPERFTEVGGVWSCSAVASDGSLASARADAPEITLVDGWPAPITFTNCGKTGATGPSQTECNTRYAGSALEGKVTLDKGIQTWRVPVTGDYLIEARGAQGNKDTNRGWGTAGTGAIISGVVRLERGTMLQIAVGQMGSNDSWGAGGGGGTWVMTDEDEPVMVAGGGGGIGYYGSQRYSRACDGSLTEFATAGFSGTSSTWGSCTGVETTRLKQGGLGGTGSSSGSCQYGAGGGGLEGDGVNDTCSGSTTGGRGWVNGAAGDSGTASGGFGGGGSGPWSGGGGGGYSGGDGSRGGAGGGGSFNGGTSKSARTGNTSHGSVIIDLLD